MIVDVRAIGIHARAKAADPHMAVVALLPGDRARIDDLLAILMHIAAAHAEGLARLVGEQRAGVALIPIPLAVRAGGDGVQAVIVLRPLKPVSSTSRLSTAGSNFRSPFTSV